MSAEDYKDADVQGDLARYPFPRLLFYLYKKVFLGHLRLRRGEGDEAKVYFRNGLPVFVEVRAMEDVLGHVLLERGWITTEQFEASLAGLAKGEKRHGQLLLEMGAIDAPQLINGLRLQLRRKLNRLFQLREGVFGLYGGEHPHGADAEGAQVNADPLWLIHQGVRNSFDSSRLAPELRKLRGSRLHLNPHFVPLLGRYGLAEDERGLAQVLTRGPVAFEDVFRVSGLSRTQIEMLLYTFWVTEALVVAERAASKEQPATAISTRERPVVSQTVGVASGSGAPDGQSGPAAPGSTTSTMSKAEQAILASAPDIEALVASFDLRRTREAPAVSVAGQPSSAPASRPATAAPSAAVPRATAPPPPVAATPTNTSSGNPAASNRRRERASADAGKLRAEIEKRLKAAAEQNHFELLGLARDVSTDDVHGAYLKLAKEFHPDRLSGLGLDEETCHKAEELFARIADANTVLSDARSRADYAKSLDAPDGAAEEARALLDAEMAFQRATVFFRKRDYRQALEQFQEAYRLNQQEGEHLAWLTWTRWCDPRGDGKAVLAQLIKDLKKSVTISPRRAQSHYFLGELLLASGDDKRAIASFEAAVEINAQHVDALRQLRLIRMRQEKDRRSSTTTLKAISRFLKK